MGRTHSHQRTDRHKEYLRHLPEVEAALDGLFRGGLPEAVIRMLILLAEARGSVRGSRLARAEYTISNAEPFASLGAERRASMIREQTLIVLFDRDAAIAFVDLLPDLDMRAIALGTINYIAGPVEEMEEHTIRALQNLRRVLELPPLRIPDDQTMSAADDQEPVRSAIEAA
jgi:hypothetical protein